MTLRDLATEMEELAVVLDATVRESQKPEIREVLISLRSACNVVGRAWSKSWIGYHSRTYYKDFGTPPPSVHFSVEWGLMNVSSSSGRGSWVEYTSEEIREEINDRAGNPDRGPMLQHEALAKVVLRESQASLSSMLVTARQLHDDDIIRDAIDTVRSMRLKTVVEVFTESMPTSVHSRDRRAIDEGIEAPVHIQTLAILEVIEMPDLACKELSGICKHVAQHLRRVEMVNPSDSTTPHRVFIGHGRSLQWRVLKDYLADTLGLPWEEFNRVPVAGYSTKERLEQMLRTSSMALLVCTAEDERESGVLHARENVIHEAGLFQGRLSFERAIIMLEDGCTGFSNIDGLTVIKFPSGNIAASFEEVRRVLQREGIVS